MRPPLSARAAGRWGSLLPTLGVDAKYLSKRQGPCPICGGKTRFRFDDLEGRGTWICNHCGAGDGADLAMRVTGLDFRALAERIEPLIGGAERTEPNRKRSVEDCREGLNRLWRSSSPVRDGDPVARYLHARVGLTSAPDCLRSADRLRYHDDEPSWHPAMIAMVMASNGVPATLHRTYLTTDGRKAAVEAPRRLMPGPIPEGSAIRLFESGPVLGIAEGIETALAAASLFAVPVWAAVSASMLARWMPPGETQEIIVFGDADQKYGGQAAAFALAHRLTQLPHRDLTVRVEIPATPGQDWAEVLNAQHAARNHGTSI